MDHAALKKELRKQLKAIRSLLTETEIQEKSEAIFRHWKNHFSLDSIRTLHLFLSMPSYHEVETSFIRNYVESAWPGIRVVVPVVEPVSDSLRHVWVAPDVEMVKSRFGVPEPKLQTAMVQPHEVDMVIVPLLGFDDNGNRIGYGKGHYDRFLSALRPDCVKIGVAFDCTKLAQLPAEPHDEKLDFVVTETSVQPF